MVFRRKLPRSSFVLLCVSVSCAVAAGFVMQAYAHRLNTIRPDGGAPLTVVATTAPVARGAVLTETTLEVVTLPTRFVPPGAVRDLTRATGRIAVTDMAAGEVVTDYDVGVDGIPPVTHEEVLKVFGENIDTLRDLLFAAIPEVPAERTCPCASALAGTGHA